VKWKTGFREGVNIKIGNSKRGIGGSFKIIL
jgi:hypothetical protein